MAEGDRSPKARKTVSTSPKTIDLVLEAIKNNPEKKGTTVQAIKTYILENHPEVDPSHLKFRLKRAFEKGIDNELLVRPKSDEDKGASLSGRYKLNKAKVEALAKPKKVVKKKKEEVEKKKKTPTKKKAKESTKSPKSPSVKKASKKSPKKGTKSPSSEAKKVKKTTKKMTAESEEKPQKKKKSTEKTPEKKKKTKSPAAKKLKPKKSKA